MCVEMVHRLLNSKHVFLYKSYVKCGSAGKCWRTFHCKFPGKTVQSTTGMHELIMKVRSTGLLLDKEPARENHASRRKIYMKYGQGKHIPQK